MNSSCIFNIKRKKTLNLLMSYLPKARKLEIVQKNKRLQEALKIKEILYEIYSLKNLNQSALYKLDEIDSDNYTKREILNSLFEISNLPFLNNIGFTLTGHTKRICSIKVIPPLPEGETLLASWSWDSTVKVWDMTAKTLLFTLPEVTQEDIIISLIPLYNQEICSSRRKPIILLVLTWDKVIIFFDLRQKKMLSSTSIIQEGKLLCGIKLNDFILTSSYGKEIKVWSIENENFKEIGELKGHEDAVPKIIALQNGKVASCSWDKKIIIWNVEKLSAENTIEVHDQKIFDIIQLHNGKLATSTIDGEIRIINVGKREIEYQFKGYYYLYQLKDGRLVTGVNETQFHIVNIEKKREELVFKTKHKDNISCFLQLDDGRVVTSSFDKTINVYGFVTKKQLNPEAFGYEYLFQNNCLYITYVGK